MNDYGGSASKIKLEHLKKNEDGSIDWLPLEAPATRDHSSLVYYRHNMTAKKFTDEIKRVRQVEKKSMVLIPQHLDKEIFFA